MQSMLLVCELLAWPCRLFVLTGEVQQRIALPSGGLHATSLPCSGTRSQPLSLLGLA